MFPSNTEKVLAQTLRENFRLSAQLQAAKTAIEAARPLVKFRLHEGEPNAAVVLDQFEAILNPKN